MRIKATPFNWLLRHKRKREREALSKMKTLLILLDLLEKDMTWQSCFSSNTSSPTWAGLYHR